MAKLRLKKAAKYSSGYILLDVMAALVIAAISLVTVIGGIAQAARVAELQRSRILQTIGSENSLASVAGQSIIVK